MRLVLDTNVVVAGLLWNGHPRHLLDLAIDGDVTLFASPALIDELANTLNYPKFAQRIAKHCATTASALTVRYSALLTLVTPTDVPRVVMEDADDDQVLACAVAAQANLLVSGDKHLQSFGRCVSGHSDCDAGGSRPHRGSGVATKNQSFTKEAPESRS